MDRIERLARRIEGDSLFLAAALAAYARSEGLDDHELAARLGCAVETLGPLRLCLRPRPERFAADVDEIASRFGVDDERLAEAVRRADALARMPRRAPGRPVEGLLMAARDRAPDDAEVEPSGGTPA